MRSARGAVGLGLAACADESANSDASTSDGEVPAETAGPYPADGSNGVDVLEETGIVRSDIRSGFGAGSATAKGVPMTLELAIADLADDGSALVGAAVYVWHCDREGRYSMYPEGVEDENYLRGVQVAGDDGVVRCTSIFPACYPGRWPHIHFEVFADRADIDDSTKAIDTPRTPAGPCTPKAATISRWATCPAEPGHRQRLRRRRRSPPTRHDHRQTGRRLQGLPAGRRRQYDRTRWQRHALRSAAGRQTVARSTQLRSGRERAPVRGYYIYEHRHSGIALHTPASVHHGTAGEIRVQRQQTLDAAHAAHPERFGYRRPQAPEPPTAAWINQPSPEA